jgi:hypothetical protein
MALAGERVVEAGSGGEGHAGEDFSAIIRFLRGG